MNKVKFIIIIIFLIVMTGCSLKKCEPIIDKAVISSVYHSPDSFGGYEHWSGIAVKENGERVCYETIYPVEVGQILSAKRGCGYINQPF